MFEARLLCSDPACAETTAQLAALPAELEVLACACGAGLEVLALSEVAVLTPARPRLRVVAAAPAEPLLQAA